MGNILLPMVLWPRVSDNDKDDDDNSADENHADHKVTMIIGTFRFSNDDENEYELWLPVFSENTLKIYNPDNLSFSLLAV